MEVKLDNHAMNADAGPDVVEVPLISSSRGYRNMNDISRYDQWNDNDMRVFNARTWGKILPGTLRPTALHFVSLNSRR